MEREADYLYVRSGRWTSSKHIPNYDWSQTGRQTSYMYIPKYDRRIKSFCCILLRHPFLRKNSSSKLFRIYFKIRIEVKVLLHVVDIVLLLLHVGEDHQVVLHVGEDLLLVCTWGRGGPSTRPRQGRPAPVILQDVVVLLLLLDVKSN